MRKKIRLVIVGAGVIGSHHGKVVNELSNEIELTGVVDVDLAKAQALASSRGSAAFVSLKDALAQAEFEAVAVCTPTGTHAEVAIEALNAGKHVIIEKPAEVSLEKTDAIIEAQRNAGTVVTVISQHRFDPATEILLEAINKGELGRLTSGIASIDWWRSQDYYDSGDWRGTWDMDGGGSLMNQGVHTVDLLVAALGKPVSVFAYTGRLAHENIEVEDVAVAVVKFENGALGVLHASTAAFPGLSARLQVHGDKGSVVIEGDRLTFIHTTPGQAERMQLPLRDGVEANQLNRYKLADDSLASAGMNPGQLSDAHRYQYGDFLNALGGVRGVRVGLTVNRQSISVILGAYESARTGMEIFLD